MTLKPTWMAHLCPGRTGRPHIEAEIEDSGKYWWGIVDGIRMKQSFRYCPDCGEHLSQPEPVKEKMP